MSKEAATRRARVLITGGGGQLGRTLVRAFAGLPAAAAEDAAGPAIAALGFTYRGEAAPAGAPRNVQAFQVDLADGAEGGGKALSACLAEFRPDVVVNCAAIARPRECEADPKGTAAINVPSALVRALAADAALSNCLVVQISTDVVYDGDESQLYTEESAAVPVNEYGRSKLEAERYLAAHWPNHVCLRSSMIYGPVRENESSTYFTTFVDTALAKSESVGFFHDEIRSPVYVMDFVTAILALVHQCFRRGRTVAEAGLRNVYNFGGPQALSRLEMAQRVAALRGHDQSLILPTSAKDVDRGVRTPLDTGMDSSKVAHDFGFQPTSFDQGIVVSFAPGAAEHQVLP